MPLLPVPIDLPPHLIEVSAGDVDLDGRRELVLVSAPPAARPGDPRRVSLTLVHLGPDARVEGRATLALPAGAAFWSAEGPLWRVDGAGLHRSTGEGWTRVLDQATPLASLGPTEPARAELARDLDGDGLAEAWVWSAGRFTLVDGRGRVVGSFAAPARGSLADREEQGGQGLRVTLRVPPVEAVDVEGDGVLDLVVPDGDRLLVQQVLRGPEGLALGEARALGLPRPLVDAEGEEERQITDLAFADVDGDGRVDLVVHELLTAGGFFGATAEVLLYPGQPRGFGEARRLSTGTGSAELGLHDLDADGDLDLVLGQVDLSFTNLARGLLARSVELALVAHPFAGGAFAAEGEPLQALSVDLSDPRFAWTLDGDFDGDGAADLAWMDGPLLTLRLSGRPGAPETLRLSTKVERLSAVDLSGDGRPELVAWAEGEARATMIVFSN